MWRKPMSKQHTSLPGSCTHIETIRHRHKVEILTGSVNHIVRFSKIFISEFSLMINHVYYYGAQPDQVSKKYACRLLKLAHCYKYISMMYTSPGFK